MKTVEVVQERYDKASLQALIEQGVAKPFHLSPQTGAIANFLNTTYENRIDIKQKETISGIPVQIFIMVDKTDGVPWSWNFSFNLAQAERNGHMLDTDKIRELTERFSLLSNKVSVEAISHPLFTKGEQYLQVSALNLPPAQIVGLFQAIFSEAIH